MSYRTVIGLEVHVQLLTQTKLFCGCSTKFGLPPNSATCPICIGMPGTLPVMNGRAFELALKAALALNCRIASFTKWDRKNYFYPDLPKNYQISQYDLPFSSDGWLEIPLPDGQSKKIGIIRAHLEEDAGKMMHDEKGHGRESLVDLNRAGTPLLEIVSQPELTSPEEARAYLEEIRLLLRELEVSDCEMQEGSLRCDANVNVHVELKDEGGRMKDEEKFDSSFILPPSSFPYVASPIVEIKNLNSIRGVERALKYEAERQFEELQQKLGSDWELGPAKKFGDRAVHPVHAKRQGGGGSPIPKATAGWDDKRGITEVQRRKEEASDYRYFPEPDLVPIVVDAGRVETIRANLGELPASQLARLQSQFALSAYDAGVLVRQGRSFVAYFEEAVRIAGDAKEACNWMVNDLLQSLNEKKLDIKSCPLPASHLGELIVEVKNTGLNKQRAREVYAVMLNEGLTVKDAIARLGFTVVSDESQLLEIVRRAIAANPKAVADFKKGKTKAADAIKGAVMRETKGMAKTEAVQRLLLQELS